MFPPNDPFLIRNPLEIEQWLDQVLSHQALLQIADVHGRTGFLTTLIDINPTEQLMFIDAAREHELNEQLVHSEQLLLTTHIDRVPLQIPATNLQYAEDRQGGFLYCPIPQMIRRLQRRSSFRVDVPKIPPALCTVPHEQGTLQLMIDNISATGAAMVTHDLALPLERGVYLQDSVLELPQTEPFVVDMMIVRTQDLSKNEKDMRLFGCAFQNLDPHTERNLQNYIFTLQRIEASRHKGHL